MKKQLFVLLAFVLLAVTGCKTYTIPLDSFKQQFDGMDSTQLMNVSVHTPFGNVIHYQANPLPYIQCVDNKGQAFELKNSPSIETRFTYGPNGNRVVFYFDRIFVSDSTVTGVMSRILPAIRKTIPLNSVTKIEVQDGKKRYFYVKS